MDDPYKNYCCIVVSNYSDSILVAKCLCPFLSNSLLRSVNTGTIRGSEMQFIGPKNAMEIFLGKFKYKFVEPFHQSELIKTR